MGQASWSWITAFSDFLAIDGVIFMHFVIINLNTGALLIFLIDL